MKKYTFTFYLKRSLSIIFNLVLIIASIPLVRAQKFLAVPSIDNFHEISDIKFPNVRGCISAHDIHVLSKVFDNDFPIESSIYRRLHKIFTFGGPEVKEHNGIYTLAISDPQLRFLNWYGTMFCDAKNFHESFYIYRLFTLILKRLHCVELFAKEFENLPQPQQIDFLNKFNEIYTVYNAEITESFLMSPLMKDERLRIYEMIVVMYAHLFYIYFFSSQPVLDIYFENNNAMAELIEEKCIDPILELYGLNLFALTHLSIDELEYVAKIRPSRVNPHAMQFTSDPEEIRFYQTLQQDIMNACGIQFDMADQELILFSFTMSLPRENEWIRNYMNSIPVDQILKAIRDLLRRNNAVFITDTLLKQTGKSIDPKDISKNITVEYRNEAAKQGIFRVIVYVHDKDKKTTVPYVFGLSVSKNDLINQFVDKEFEATTHFRARCPAIAKFYHKVQIPIIVEGIKTTVSVFSMEWKEGFEEVNFVSRKMMRDGVCPYKGLVEPGDKGMGVILNTYGDDQLQYATLPEDEGKRIKKEIVKIITSCFDPEKNERIENPLYNAGDFLYNPKTKEICCVSCGSIDRMLQQSYHGYTHDELNVITFIFKLLSSEETSQCVDDVPKELWGKYKEYIFEPDDVFDGIKEALVEQYGPDEGISRMKSWLGLYVSDLNVLNYHVPKGTNCFFRETQRYLDSLGGLTERPRPEREMPITNDMINNALKTVGVQQGVIVKLQDEQYENIIVTLRENNSKRDKAKKVGQILGSGRIGNKQAERFVSEIMSIARKDLKICRHDTTDMNSTPKKTSAALNFSSTDAIVHESQ